MKTKWNLEINGMNRNVFDEGEAEWCIAEIDRVSKGDDCVDNYRFARKSDPESVKRYNHAKDYYGCCGFADWEETRTVGTISTVYLLGYNHGH
jgi:hypothetical protein